MRAGMNHQRTVLVAEDNDDIRSLLRVALEADGYRVVEAGDGGEVVERARRERPDVVLLDLSMPGADGLEAARRLRSSEVTKGVPLIAVSANPAEEFREAALAAGCDCYVSKPIDFDLLECLLRRYCPATEEARVAGAGA
jgi:CheY-like chemotaxis protein